MKKNNQSFSFLFLLFILVFFQSYAQNSNHNNPLSDAVDFDFQETYQDSLILLQEHVILHVANEYVGNDNLFFKAYLLSGIQKVRRSLSNVLIVELLDLKGDIIKRQFHKVIDGTVDGNLDWPKNIESGKYYLKAYTRWMQNYDNEIYAKKPIWLGDLSDETLYNASNGDTFIFPEGGHLLNGYESRVVIKMPFNERKKEEKVGEILDDQNNTVAEVINYFGISTTMFKPIKGNEYRSILKNGMVYPIPNAQNQGYLLQVNNLDLDKIKIRVTSSYRVLETDIKLVGIFEGKKYFENELVFKNDNVLNVELSKEDFSNGILILKLVDEEDNELGIRPVLIETERLNIDISPIPSDTQEKSLKIKVTDRTNSPVRTQLALSVKKTPLNNKFIFENYPIEYSDLFIYPDMIEENNMMMKRKSTFLKDLIVLASYVNADNTPLDSNSFGNEIKYSIQKGLELACFAYDFEGKLLVNTKIQIIAQSEDEIWFKESETDVNGLLKLKDIQLNGKSKLIFRTKGTDEKSRLVKLRPINQKVNTESRSSIKITKKEARNLIFEPTLWKTNRELDNMNELRTWESIDSTGLIELDEAQIVKKRQEGKPSVYGISAAKQRTKYQDPDKPKSFNQLLSGIPGVTVSGVGDFASIRINRASGSVLWVIDGFPLAQDVSVSGFGSSSTNSLQTLLDIGLRATDIERIEILVGAEAAIYGTRAAGGVVLVYTRTGDELDYISRNEGQLVLNGYERNLEFDNYRQNLSKREKDNSNLLYWNPKLETDKNGEVLIRFPSSKRSLIKIQATTITPKGEIGSSNATF